MSYFLHINLTTAKCCYDIHEVSRQVTPGQVPVGQVPGGQVPGGQVPGRTSARRTSAREDKLPQDKCHGGQVPPTFRQHQKRSGTCPPGTCPPDITVVPFVAHDPTLCPKGTQTPLNWITFHNCWQYTPNTNIYLENIYSPTLRPKGTQTLQIEQHFMIAGSIYPILIYISNSHISKNCL